MVKTESSCAFLSRVLRVNGIRTHELNSSWLRPIEELVNPGVSIEVVGAVLETGPINIEALQKILGVTFKDDALLTLSMTHSSFSNERGGSKFLEDNERLEFLGDAVIGLVIAEGLMEKHSEATEGQLSRWRSTLVSRKMLAECAVDLGLSNHILLGKGEERSGGREKTSILAGAFEAVVGAIYLDLGFEAAANLLKRVFEPHFAELEAKGNALWRSFDQKTHLQERTQSLFRAVPSYRLVDSWGLEHEKNFKVEVELEGKVIAEGVGKSKKEAEQSAASVALDRLKELHE